MIDNSASDLGEVINLFADPVSQDDKNRYGHLHIALFCIVAQHLPYNGAKEASRKMRVEQGLGNGDEREGLYGRQTSDFCLVAADMWGVGLVLLKVLGSRRVIHDLVAQLKGLLG